ncbi:GyrI-like domain-containing protein [candidate division WOR-3 bacterium]|nr:GyrI-like domain-containing protein [candidate division WOR-3 bacterium]
MMTLKELGIKHKTIEEMLVTTISLNLKERKKLYTVLDELTKNIPRENIMGPPFCIFQFVTSIKEGFDVEVGLPVAQAVEIGRIKTRILPEMEVLSLVHKGPVEELKETYGKLYGCASEHGLISDEFCREVYLESNDPDGDEIELQFVLHNWNELLGRNLERVLGEEGRRKAMQGSDKLTLESTVDERFHWVKRVMERLDKLADEGQKYDIISSCAHVFPGGQIEKLKSVYEKERTKTDDPLKAVDAVIEFMGEDPGWGERPLRKGNVIYSTKQPRDPKGYKNAKSESEKRRSYCFCPLMRNHLDEDMSIIFCYCGAGWCRQQWEGAIGKPVRIEVVKSVLKGDDVCQFAIHLPEDIESS